MGPLTGRGAGYCAGYGPWAAGGGFGMGRGGLGCGRGGRGYRHWFYATGLPGWMRAPGVAAPAADPERTKQALRSRAEALEAELEAIRSRLDQMGTQKPAE